MHAHSMTHSSLGHWAVTVVKVLEQYGQDSHAMLIAQDIPPDSLKKSHARISNQKVSELWGQVQKLCGDPFIALKLLHSNTSLSFGTLGMSMTASQHAHDALKRFVRFSHYLNDGLQMNLSTQPCQVILDAATKPGYEKMNHRNIEAVFSSLVTLLQSISDTPLKLKSVMFEHELCHDAAPFEDFFNCPVYFGGQRNQIIFCENSLNNEHAFSNSDLSGKLDEWLQEGLQSSYQGAWCSQVSNTLKSLPTLENITIKDVAKKLSMHVRVLQVKLKEEHSSYTHILDNFRQNTALKKISDQHTSLIQLSMVLGFSDQSNFSRAFKRWTGSSPHQYRNNKR